MKPKLSSSFNWLTFVFVWVGLVAYSFCFLDLNLTLYRFSWFQKIKPFFNQLGYYQRPLSTLIFLLLVTFLTGLYFNLIKKKIPQNNCRWISRLLPIIGLGLVSYPMFSHDIFNYIFNAKMVLFYQSNPHLQAASQFLFDPWTRFMHNIDTPAPYAYGWTLISLLPGLITLTQKFVLSLWGMKQFIVLFWIGQLIVLKQLIRNLFPGQPWRWWLFALNPLVLVETLIVGHNDVVMMLPALLSYWFLLKSKKFFDRPQILALIFLLISISIKYATVVLLPLFLLKSYFPKLAKKFDFPAMAAFLLLAAMLTRPGQLHSWYLIWAFSFVILSRHRLVVSTVTALSIGALLRYAPYIYYGNWDPPVYFLRNLIWGLSLFLTPLIVKLTSPGSVKPTNRLDRQ